MGIFDGLGHLFHGIANFLEGGGDNAPTTVSTTTQVIRPQGSKTATQTAAGQETPFSPDLNLFQGVLQKATPPAAKPAPAPVSTATPQLPDFLSSQPLQKAGVATAPPPPIEAPKINMPLETAKQAAGGILHDLVVEPAKTIAGALNPVPIAKQWAGLLAKNPDLVKEGQQEAEANNPIFKAGHQFDQAAESDSTAAAVPHILGGLGTTAGLVGAGLSPMGAESLVKAPLNLLDKFTGNAAADAAAASEELTPGVTSVNPSKVADATQAHVDSIPDEHLAPNSVSAATAPEPPSPADLKAAADQAAAEAPVTASEMHPNELATLKQLDEAAKTRALSPEEKTTWRGLQAKQDAITAANAPEPTPVAGEVNSPAGQPATPAPGAPAEPATPPVRPVKSTSTDPTTPPSPSGQTAPNAPELRAALEKQLKEAGAPVDKAAETGGEHAVLSNDQLNEAADRVVATMGDDELVNTYKTGAQFHSASDVAQGYSALKRLGELKSAGNTDAGQAIDNILEGAAKVTSEGGRTLNYAQSMYDNLPRPAKVSYLIRSIDRLRAKGPEGKFPPLGGAAGDVAAKAKVEDAFDAILKTSEDLKTQISASEAKIQEIAANGGDAKDAAAEINKLRAAIDKAKLEYSANDGKAEQLYDSLVPKAPGGERAGDLGRTLMLSSPTGRANDLLTTGINVAHTLVSQTGEALVGKALNAGRALLGKDPGKYISKIPSLRTVVKGGATGLQKSAGEFKGNVYAGDLVKDIKSGNAGGKTGLLRASNGPVAAVKRFIRAGAELATNASAGVKDAQIERLADQEGRQLGLKGDALKTHIAERQALPTKVMQDNATRLHEEVNNINDNPLSTAFGKAANAITRLGDGSSGAGAKTANAIGEQVRNLAIPFTKWAGGQAWNAVTDKNVIANAAKLVTMAVKGAAGKGVDSQEVVSQLSKLATNATLSMTIGYKLAQQGLITDKNPEGYNDDGLYLHVGGRYVPAATLGFLAPSMILGASTYHGFNDTSDKPVSQKIADTAQNVFQATWKAYLSNTIIGEQNATEKAAVTASQPNSNVSGLDVAATAAGQTAGQYIPAVTSDINSVLNNYTSLDPTHEKADTSPKKVNPTTGNPVKDYKGAAVAGLQNKIPGLSQQLPRKAGEAAPDLIDRTLRGERDTTESIKTAADAKAKVDQSAADKAANVPDPNGKYKNGDSFESAVQARIDGGNYKAAAAGLQQKLDSYAGDPDVAKKTTDALQTKIKELGVLQAGHYDPSIIDTYKNTSVSDWRKMGDPEDESYDQKTYDLLWQYDNQLAKAGASGDPHDPTDTKFSVKPPGKGRGGSGNKSVTSNTLGSTPNLKSISFGNLSPQKVSATATIPTIQQIKPADLIKKRTISVTKA